MLKRSKITDTCSETRDQMNQNENMEDLIQYYLAALLYNRLSGISSMICG